MTCANVTTRIFSEEKRRIDRKGPVVRAEINTALFAQFSAQVDQVPVIEIVKNQPMK